MATHGGKRAGSGRKPKADKHRAAINRAEKRIADRLPQIIDNLFALADGGYERIEEEWQPAGTVTIGTGENLRKAFPHTPDDELVLTKRKRSIADRDRAANIYLADRILGRPTEHVESDVTSNGETLSNVIILPDNGRQSEGP